MIPQKRRSRTPPVEDNRRRIPAVNELLRQCLEAAWSADYSRSELLETIRQEVATARNELKSGTQMPPDASAFTERVHQHLQQQQYYSLRKVINATGIIVHTNLGRAPLGEAALAEVIRVAGGYSNLEFDLVAGERGSRDEHVESLLNRLVGAEASLVVNNNAAALLLIVNSLAEGKEVLVSRGELVEIGGSFRLPEIMKKSGAILKEIGTTNKTRLDDYRRAITENTGMILVVHPSNYQIIGFTEKPSLQEVVELGHSRQIPVAEDHGSGILFDLQSFGIAEEPSVQERLNEGVDLISFSGDKILGGPQAGIICGKRVWLQRLRANPLFRALRVDKMTYSALAATLVLYMREKLDSIPVVAAIRQDPERLEERARAWSAELQQLMPAQRWGLEQTSNYIGGGVAPMKGLDSWAVTLQPTGRSCEEIARALRDSDPPVICRIAEDRIYFEVRTILVAEQGTVTAALERILKPRSHEAKEK